MDEARKWLEFAKTDLGVSRLLLEVYYPQPLEIICYHCQQAAEKAIKSVVLYHGAPGGLPKKHNLSFLLEQIKNLEEIPEEYYDYADALTPYGITVRYPDELSIQLQHAMKAIDYAEKFVCWAENVVQE